MEDFKAFKPSGLTTNGTVLKNLKLDLRESSIGSNGSKGSTKVSTDAQIHPSTPAEESTTPYKREIVWFNVLKLTLLHIFGFWNFVIIPFASDKTVFFVYIITLLTSIGVQCGAHRMWAHKGYKANFGVRLFLAICHTLAMQNDIYEWCRDHRVHHKFSDTDADPHNSNRGFFFSHMGWLMVKKHPDVFRKGATVDLSDLEADPIVMFQRKYYYPLLAIFWGFIPTIIPVIFWNESIIISFFYTVLYRYGISLHITWLVNSWAHMYGYKPYNSNIVPVEASIRHALVGEGFHNYHHMFPNDYRASELGFQDVFNPQTAIIEFFAYMGWAWDLKTPDPKVVAKTIAKSGDPYSQYDPEDRFHEQFWGYFVLLAPYWTNVVYKYGFLYFWYQTHTEPWNWDLVNWVPEPFASLI